MTAHPPSTKATHAGGVVYREHGDAVEYLLVQARSPLREWVLPKGHIEPGESARDAAVREVHEEAGIPAEIVDELDTIEYTLRDQRVRVRFYLMKALLHAATPHAAGGSHEAEREHTWLPLEEARQRLAYDSYRTLLALAERKRHEA